LTVLEVFKGRVIDAGNTEGKGFEAVKVKSTINNGLDASVYLSASKNNSIT
jgi:hypothetical protein